VLPEDGDDAAQDGKSPQEIMQEMIAQEQEQRRLKEEEERQRLEQNRD